MLTDQHHRIHDYLRISLTDQCNFRCQYCMPVEEMPFMPKNQLMQAHEIEDLAKIFVELGIKKIRLTGGEPLVRKDFGDIIQRLATLPIELTLTSNGVLIDKYIALFKEKNIKTINISLDTLNPKTFFQITKRDFFDRVWKNILMLLENDFRVKINVVALNGLIQNELCDFIELTKKLPLHIRFIEFMPFESNFWHSKEVVTANQLLKIVQEKYDIIKLKDLPNDTAKKYKVIGHEGTFAFITTMSQHFCTTCNRIRLTADGKIKNCLFGKHELDLLTALRKNENIVSLIQDSIKNKFAVMGGQFEKGYQQTQAQEIQNRSMIRIGG